MRKTFRPKQEKSGKDSSDLGWPIQSHMRKCNKPSCLIHRKAEKHPADVAEKSVTGSEKWFHLKCNRLVSIPLKKNWPNYSKFLIFPAKSNKPLQTSSHSYPWTLLMNWVPHARPETLSQTGCSPGTWQQHLTRRTWYIAGSSGHTAE